MGRQNCGTLPGERVVWGVSICPFFPGVWSVVEEGPAEERIGRLVYDACPSGFTRPLRPLCFLLYATQYKQAPLRKKEAGIDEGPGKATEPLMEPKADPESDA